MAVDEELKIKVVVDSAEADKKLDRLEKDFKGGAQGTQQMSESTKELINEIKKLTHLDIGKFGMSAIAKAKELKKQFDSIKPTIKELKESIKNIKNSQSGLKEKINNANAGAWDYYTKGAEKLKARLSELKDMLSDTPEDADDYDLIQGEMSTIEDQLGKFKRWGKNARDNFISGLMGKPHGISFVVDSLFTSDEIDSDGIDMREASGIFEEARNSIDTLRKNKELLKAKRKERRKNRRERLDILFNGYDEEVKGPDGKSLTDSNGEVIKMHKAGLKVALAFATIYFTIKAIKKAVKEVNASLNEANNIIKSMNAQNLSSVKGYQEMKYVMDTLGISADQYYQLLEKGDERVVDLIKHYQKLGGEYNERQAKQMSDTKTAINDMKIAWRGVWNDVADVFNGPIQTVVKGLTVVALWLSETFSKKTQDSDTILANAKKTTEELYAMKRALAGFDELNILQQMVGTNNVEFPNYGEEIKAEINDAVPEEKEVKIDLVTGELPEVEIKFTSNIQSILDQIADAEERLSKLSIIAQEPVKQEIADLKEQLKEELQQGLDVAGPQPTEPTETQKLYSEALKRMAEIDEHIAERKADHMAVDPKTAEEKWKLQRYIDQLAEQLEEEAKLANAELAKALASGMTSDEIKSSAQGAGKAIAGYIMNGVNSMIPKMVTLQPYATGGVITRPTAALIGEYSGARSNPEIVSPKSTMYEMMLKANGDMASVYAQVGRQIIQAIDEKNLSVSIGDKDVAEATNRYNNNYRRVTGKSLLTV